MQYKELTPLTTERLILRGFTLQDADEVTRLCNNYNMYINTLNLPYPYTKEGALQWISSHPEVLTERLGYQYAVTLKQTGQVMGAVSVFCDERHNKGEIGYWLGEEYWNHGYATEAAARLISFCFTQLRLHRVFAYHYDFNLASGRVMEKIGMVKEGFFPDQYYKDGRYISAVAYGMINPEDMARG